MLEKCLLCNLEFRNNVQFKQHIEGKKHRAIEGIKKSREETASRSLFVSGFRKDTELTQLEEYFLQYGRINKIIMDQEKNAYAIIEFETEPGAMNALAANESGHKLNGKTLHVKKRQLKEFKNNFSNSNEKKNEVLEKIKGEALLVNKKIIKCNTFEEQINCLIESVSLNDKDLLLREMVCADLKKLFNKYWKDDEFEVAVFGSTLTHLAVKGSDLDLTINFASYLGNTDDFKKQKEFVKEYNLDGSGNESVSEMNEESVSDENENHLAFKDAIYSFFKEKKYHEFSAFELEHQIKTLAKILHDFNGIKQLRTIITARTPVVRMFIENLNVYCDLSLNNYLAKANSQLIQVYLDLVPNLRKVLYVIRYWMKHKNLNSANKLNNYSITWMVIFYMQKQNICRLPTVQMLADMKEDQEMLVNGWKCAFETNPEKIRAANNKSNQTDQASTTSLNDLLKGFFAFYSTFEFGSKIISLRKAEVLLESPQDHNLSRLTSIMNIQDPLDLSHNITANVNQNTLDHFIAECKACNELLEYGKEPTRHEAKCWGLSLLVTKKVLPIIPPSKPFLPNKPISDRCAFKLKFSVSDKMTQSCIDFMLFLIQDCLKFEKIDGTALVNRNKKRSKVLNDICDQVDDLGLSPKRLRVTNDSDAESDYMNKENEWEKEFTSFQFRINNRTWQGRRNMKRSVKQTMSQIVSKLSPIELEQLISQKLIDSEENNNTMDSNNICMNLIIYKEFENIKVRIECLQEEAQIAVVNNKFMMQTLSHFLDEFINNCHTKFFDTWLTSK